MILFADHLVGNMDEPALNATDDAAELLEDSEAFMPSSVDEPVVAHRKSRVIFFAYFIPIIFLILGVIVFMGAVVQKFKKWFSRRLEKDQTNPDFKNYGTCHSGNMRLFQHCPPSTSRSRSLSEGDSKINETLTKELEKRLEGDNTKDLSFKTRRGKHNKKLNFVQIA